MGLVTKSPQRCIFKLFVLALAIVLSTHSNFTSVTALGPVGAWGSIKPVRTQTEDPSVTGPVVKQAALFAQIDSKPTLLNQSSLKKAFEKARKDL